MGGGFERMGGGGNLVEETFARTGPTSPGPTAASPGKRTLTEQLTSRPSRSRAQDGNAFVQAMLQELAQGASALPEDRHAAIAKLDELTAKQLASVPQQVGTTKRTQAQEVTATPGRTRLQAQITAAGTKEGGELDAALGTELGSLDHVLATELARIDAQALAQERAAAEAVTLDDQALGKDVAGRDHANDKHVRGAVAGQATAAAKQKASLHDAADSERGWHQATHDQIMDEDVHPHVATNVAAVKTNAANQPGVARAFGTAKVAEARSSTVRAGQARTIADHEAAAIETAGKSSTKKIEGEATKLATKQDTRTAAAIKDLTREEGRQGARIDSQAGRASDEMNQLAASAHDQMAAERAGFHARAGTADRDARDAIEAARAAAKQRAAELGTRTAAKLREIHARDKATVEAKVKQLLGELAATPDNGLAKAEHHIARELKLLDGTDHAAEAAMHGDAVGAENTLVDEDQARAQAIRAAGEQARAAIAAFHAEARTQIATADKPTDRAISAAAKRGTAAIEATGASASKDFVAFSEHRQNKDVAAARNDLEAFDASATTASLQLSAMAMGVNTKIDKQWVDDTLGEATPSLDGKTRSGPTGDEATAGMRSLLTLPGHLQGDAIERLTDKQFATLLARVPDGSREELASLVTHTKDPKRKLKLWGVYHKAHAMHDAMNDHAGTDAESQRRHAARVGAATTTAAEVDDEIAFMENHARSTGKPFSEANVNELIARKDTEHAMEMKYNVNFTNDPKLRADGSHVHWKKTELDALDNTMRRMPEDHLAGNAGLTEIHRQEIVYWGDPRKNVQIGGIATGTKVLIPDNAVDTSPSKEARQLAPAEMSVTVSWMEWLITHELGHNVSNKYSAEYEKYRTANGWESYPAATDKLTADEKATLDAKRSNKYTDRAQVTKGGKTYEIDQQVKDGYISYTQGALPPGTDSVPGEIGGNDPWAYARTRDFEQFAEHYDRAMQVPEKVYQDLIEQPHQATEARRKEYDAAASAADKATAKDKLDIAVATEKARKESFEIMRNQVFGTAKAQQAAEARLKARGIDTTEFNKQAAHASTPDQIAVIEAKLK